VNYRHAYHAGNFADVLKHAVLARIVAHLRAKPAPFRVIDTHAGLARYDLAGPEASRTGEWRDGIARLLAARRAPAVERLLAPYLEVVAKLNRDGELRHYPGSPEIIRAGLRPHDRLAACELEPNAVGALTRNMARDPRVKVVAIDGWTALSAQVPPKERRGLAFIDAAFEEPDELARLPDRFAAAHRKWPTGIYVLWYPIKQRREADAFARHLARLGVPKILRVELAVAALRNGDRLNGCGLAIANPPWSLERELAVLVPALAAILARDDRAAGRLDWLAGEK